MRRRAALSAAADLVAAATIVALTATAAAAAPAPPVGPPPSTPATTVPATTTGGTTATTQLPVPSATPPAATPPPGPVTVEQAAQTAAAAHSALDLFDDGVYANLARYADSSPDTVARLTAIGLRTGDDLRAAAGRVANAATDTTDTTAGTVTRGRRIVQLLYPQLPGTLDAGDVVTVLQVTAAGADAGALADYQDSLRAALNDPRNAGTGPATRDDHDPDRPRLLPAGAYLTLADLFAHRAELRLRTDRQLLTLAQAVLSAAYAAPDGTLDVTGLPDAATLAAIWSASPPRRMNAMLAALSHVGDRYRFAGRGPDRFDCSGLTSYAWSTVGLQLPGSSLSQQDKVTSRPVSRLRPGDLVFWPDERSRDGRIVGHVAFSLGAGTLTVEAAAGAGRVQVSGFYLSQPLRFGTPRLAGETTRTLHLP